MGKDRYGDAFVRATHASPLQVRPGGRLRAGDAACRSSASPARRGRPRLRLLLSLALLLAACGPPAGRGGGAAEATPTPPPATATSAQAAVSSPTPPASAARGAQAFAAWCNSCHPGGQAGNGPALWGRGLALTPARIRRQIRETPDQRERQRFATLADDRLDDVIAFIIEQQRLVDGGGTPAE